MKSRAWIGITLFTLSCLASCSEDLEPLVLARCEDDVECGTGFICELGECTAKTNVSCASVEGGAAILQPGPPVVDFERVGPATSFRSLRLRNIGNCTLTIYEVKFDGADSDSFECPRCNDSRFPMELFPLRDEEIQVAFTPEREGSFYAELKLLSDDAEYAEIRVPVRAKFEGVPLVNVAPGDIDFSYVEAGRTVEEVVRITNQGTGTAPLTVLDVRLARTGTSAFTLESMATFPSELAPATVDATASIPVYVKYQPRDIGSHSAELIVITNQQRNGTVRIPLKGTSKTPPKVNISPDNLNFGEVPIGRTNVAPLTIVNEGGSPLSVTYRWGGTNFTTDLSALPAILPPIQPGQYTELQVFASATAVGELTGLLIFETNDPQKPTITVPVSARGTDVIGNQVVKIEMSFENGESGFFGDDLRNVDMSLENPFGQLVNKQQPSPMWGGFGNPTWFAFGVSEEPERIILPDAQNDGTYRVILQYVEDCASVPTQLLAGVLGISVSSLTSYLSGGAVNIDGDRVSNAISSLCLNREGTQATVTVYVNGQVVTETTIALGQKGDVAYAIDLVRQNGTYTVR